MKIKPRSMFVIFLAVFGAKMELIEGADVENTTGSGYCAAPIIADNLDIQWANEHSHVIWHITTGSVEARNHVYEFVQGKNLTEGSVSDFSDMCAQLTIDIDSTGTNFKGKYLGYGDKSANWSCSIDDGEFHCKYENNPDHTYVQHAKSYVSYFDGKESHNVFVNVFCFDDGISGWFAASLTKTLNEEEKETVDNHLKSIGFDPTKNVALYGDKCA